MSLIESLADRAYQRISTSEYLSHKGDSDSTECFLKDIYKLLQSEKYYPLAVRKLCFVCDDPPEDPLNIDLLNQCIDASRIFLYKSMLNKKDVSFGFESIFEIAQKSFYSLDGEVILTKEQKELYDHFLENPRLVVSAPTSFGKSHIIKEIIAHNTYNQIVIVVPTNALLGETYFSFKSDRRFSGYSFVFSTHMEPPEGNAIFVFTPEKFDVYTDEYNINYDFFVFDEVYKIDNDDGRSSVFSTCLYKAYKMGCDYYMIGPYFNGFSSKFLEKTEGAFKKYDTDIVQKVSFDYFLDDLEFFGKDIKFTKNKDSRSKKVLKGVGGQTIVYVSRKDSAETRAKNIASWGSDYLESRGVDQLVEYIESNISDEWGLIECLKKGVAFHHAGIPKYIQSEIVDLFNEGLVEVIVCTPTLTEGVNTTAKNVVFYDTTKADEDLSGFEVKNIIGRAGRFGHHFVGRAFFLEEHKGQSNIEYIDYPVFDYAEIPDEDYFSIDMGDLSEKGKNKKEKAEAKAVEYSIPFSLLKKNKYIPFENQISLVSRLRHDRSIKDKLSIEHSLPNKEQVDLIMELVHEILFSPSDRKRAWTTGNLSRLVKYQIYWNPSIKRLVAQHNAAKEDTRIRNILELVYKYFEFAIPKYINALENIYNYVYEGNISLSLMTTYLQYGNDKTYNILLTDAGVPKPVVAKIAPFIKDLTEISEIRNKIKGDVRVLGALTEIEKRMLLKRI